ncbi:8100_t:CDS:2 [Dentiscutata erythropus]|uniref:8100_t:CDS:1 n=1 Tax=Dentiscutata erythropus TaxID=1348616 RepID=A0A9N9B9B4_9GLOM|nr:8100_t:CDS:2 [Dentiscutata erythropus]
MPKRSLIIRTKKAAQTKQSRSPNVGAEHRSKRLASKESQNIAITDLQEPLSATRILSNKQACNSPSKAQNVATTKTQNVATMEGQNIATTESQNVATMEGQNIATTEGQNIATTEDQNIATMEGQNIATMEGRTTESQNIATTEGRNIATMEGRNIATIEGRNIATMEGRTTECQNIATMEEQVHNFSSGTSSTSISETNSGILGKPQYTNRSFFAPDYEFKSIGLNFSLYKEHMTTFLDDDEDNYSVNQLFASDATVFEIATKVANRPEILHIANMIYQSKQQRWDQPSTSQEFPFREQSTSLPNPEQLSIKESTLEVRLRIWLEELKCLFLRTQNPSQAAFDKLVAATLPSFKLADDDFQQLLEKSRSMFNDFRHVFNKDLKNIACDNCNEDALDKNALSRYIDYNITKKILKRYLACARELEFAEMTRDALKRFVQAAFKLHVTHTHKEAQREFSSYKKVLDEIKNMNSITLSLDIPTRGKSDILRIFTV